MGTRTGLKARAMDLATAILLVAAVAVFADSRLKPAWEDRGRLDVGDRAPSEMSFVSLAAGDTVRADRGTPALYLVYRSTCPACDDVLPAWRTLLDRVPPAVRLYAVALEPRTPGLEYARRQLVPATAVRPVDEAAFLRTFDLVGVPTTLFVDRRGVLRFRRAGLLTEGDLEMLEELGREAEGPTRR